MLRMSFLVLEIILTLNIVQIFEWRKDLQHSRITGGKLSLCR